MRQIGMLESESKANRFASFLVTEGVAAHAEQEDGGWMIWVRDENHVEQAKEALDNFRKKPNHPAYEGVEQQAEAIARREAEQREAARKNMVQMREHWGRRGTARRAPLVFVLIGLSIFATLWTDRGRQPAADVLRFVGPAPATATPAVNSVLRDVAGGQLWRLVTPVFVHLSLWHLLFNMYWLYKFGVQIEDRRGTVTLGLLVLAIAILSNVAQAVIESPYFFGMSGVGFGLFGYIWIKTTFEPQLGLFVDRTTAVIFMIWFFLCLSGIVGPIANTAHGAGLAVGAAVAYAPQLIRSRRED